MKVFKSVLIILCLAISFSAFARREIVLNKKWNESIKSITPQNQIEAWLEENNRDLSLGGKELKGSRTFAKVK